MIFFLHDFKKFSLFSIICFSLAFVWGNVAQAFDGPGLYKDGKKILGFDLPELEPGPTVTAESVGTSKLKEELLTHLKGSKGEEKKFTEQEDFVQAVLQCKGLIETLQEKLETGEDLQDDLARLKSILSSLKGANERLAKKFNEMEQDGRTKGFSKEMLHRHQQLIDQQDAKSQELLGLLQNLSNAKNQGEVQSLTDELENYFIENTFESYQPMLNSQAPPVAKTIKTAPTIKLNEADQLLTAQSTYTFAASSEPGPADLQPTIDVQFTSDITALANSLNNSPLKIFEYVNSFDFEPYLGSRKGAQETLRQKSGNDYDLASLLIALLRVSNIPARYVTGTAQMPVDRAKNWLGVEDAETAGSILTTADMGGVNIIDGNGEVVAIRCRRVWVETYIPYANYRGVTNDTSGKMWVPLDPAFKQYDIQGGVDIPKEMGFDAESFINSYIETFHEQSPVELYKQQIKNYIADNHAELTFESVLRTQKVRSENLELLPGSLPFTLWSQGSRYSVIPAEKRHTIRFNIYGEGSTLDYTADLPALAGKQVTISYVGATDEDQQIIDDAGGFYGVTQPWLVHLKPVLKIDGCDVAVGSGEVTMGKVQHSDLYFSQPTGTTNEVPAIYNEIIAGTYQGIGLDTWKVVNNIFSPSTTTCQESYTGQLLHETALSYLGRVDSAHEDVNKTMQMRATKEVSDAIVENVVKVLYSAGTPISFEWSGLSVDADRSIVGPFSVTGEDKNCDYMRLTGADSSISENRLFEDAFSEEAVSTIKILELARDMGIPVYRIDSANAASILPLLKVSSTVKSAVSSAVANGRVITIPRDNITYFDWTGTGYIDMNPADCAAGYIISGGRSGGQTVKEWTFDPNAYCINATINSISPAATNDLYCGGDTRALAFNVTIKPFDKDCNAGTNYPKVFSTADPPNPMTIKDIADTYGAGEYTFSVGSTGGCGSCGVASKSFTIVKLVKLQYKDSSGSWVEISSSPFVLKGGSLDFKAVKEPAGANWPSGKPVWGGTAGASGAGDTKSVTFSSVSTSLTDYSTVTAECGDAKAIDVIVYDFEGELTPVDNFSGRSQDKYGLEEDVNLTFTTTPAGVSANQVGGLVWTKYGGVGSISNTGDAGTADYDAEETAGGVTLRLTIKSGLSAGKFKSYNKTVVAPSGTRMTRATGNVMHVQGDASAGIGLYYWLDPKDVSFSNLTFGEGAAPSTNVSGFFLKCWPWNTYPNGGKIGSHAQNYFGAIQNGDITKGCRVIGMDGAFTGAANPYAAGSFTWSIPAHYIDDTGTRHAIGNQNHVSTFQTNGGATQSKGGQSGSAALNDPSSGY